jgi:hypothetical protein
MTQLVGVESEGGQLGRRRGSIPTRMVVVSR